MNKLIIPSILSATVLVAGMFAFTPIDQASTVHTTLLGSQITFAHDDFDASAIDVTDGQEIEITSAAPFCLLDMTIEFANLEADDGLDTTAFEINDVQVLEDLVVTLVTLFTDQAAFDGDDALITSFRTQWADQRGILTPYCVEANGEIDFVLDDGGPDLDGDLIAGEVVEIRAIALVDGNVPVTVTLGAAD